LTTDAWVASQPSSSYPSERTQGNDADFCEPSGGAFGKPLTGEAESGSAEQRQENSDRSCEDALLLFNLRDGFDQLLAVLLYGLDGDDRTRTTAAPGRNG
jgi:hypothetical protein